MALLNKSFYLAQEKSLWTIDY